MKKCAGCKLEKDIDFFCNDKKSKDGKQSYCKSCKNEKIKKYHKENPDKRGKKSKEKSLEIYYKNRISMNFSRRMRKSLKGLKNNTSWEVLIGYTINDLKYHLESKFSEGMTWENYGEWHIDHIKPISSFNISSVEDRDFKLCWSLSNLQPLWAIENLRKSNKLI